MRKKIISAIPYLVTLVVLLYCWIVIILTDYAASPKHYAALILVLANGIIYFKNYKWGVLLTGILLLVGTFNLLTFYVDTKTFWIGIAGVQMPEIQYWSLLLFVVYAIINYNLLVDWYLDYKEKKADAGR